MTMTYDTVTYLTIKQYEAASGVSHKTINRYLSRGELPGAHQDERGRWMIPADAVRTPNPAGIVPVSKPPTTRPTPTELTFVPVTAPTPPTLDQRISELPGFVPIALAAEILGISRHAILKRREYFEVDDCGENGALVIRRGRIKEICG